MTALPAAIVAKLDALFAARALASHPATAAALEICAKTLRKAGDTGRIVYRLLAWNLWQHVFLRGVDALRYPLRC